MKNSIVLHSDTLTFSFGALGAEIRNLLVAYVDATSAAFVASFPSEAQAEIRRRRGGRRTSPIALLETSQRLAGFSPDQIATAYRESCLASLSDREDSCEISFQRTLRLPDDGKTYPLPAGFGRFPLRPVQAFDGASPRTWQERGGVALPMYQGEAMWLSFQSEIPCAVKILAGSVNALTGEPERSVDRRRQTDGSKLNGDPQNYVVVPDQPWLDGFKVTKHAVRQFVAMPLGSGFSVSEQLAGNSEAGGMVLEVFPMKADLYFERFVKDKLSEILPEVLSRLLGPDWAGAPGQILCCRLPDLECLCCEDMGIGAGGRIQQEVYTDQYGAEAWSLAQSRRVCVHVCNSMTWRAITGENPPHPPLSAREYSLYRVPWFDYYRDDLVPVTATNALAGVKSVGEVNESFGLKAFEQNDEVKPSTIYQFGNSRRPEEIREWCRS